LTLHNQLETAKVDEELRDMTKELGDVTKELRKLQQDTVDDSTTVMIITYVSAFYLPGSFVTVSWSIPSAQEAKKADMPRVCMA
jgi:hypothetical protein